MASRHRFALCLAFLVALATAAAPTAAAAATKPAAPAVKKPANWPTKPITAIVTYDAGGPADLTMRMIAPHLEKALGTPVQVVNKPGAGGQVGYANLLSQRPDGYTIAIAIQPTLATIYLDPRRKAGFDYKNFAGIGLMAFDPSIITVRGDSKYKTLKDLVDDAKANPGKITAGAPGILTDDHVAGLLLAQAAGIEFAYVQFTGSAPTMNAMLGGHIVVALENAGTSLAQHKAGEARALAVLDTKRSQFMPDVPTAEEQGYKVYNGSTRGLLTIAGTPKEIVDYLSYALKQAMEVPEVTKRMVQIGMEPRYMNAEEYDKYNRELEEIARPMVHLIK